MQGGAYDDYCNANLPADYYYDPDQQYHNNENSNQQFVDRCIFPHSIFACCELNLKLHNLSSRYTWKTDWDWPDYYYDEEGNFLGDKFVDCELEEEALPQFNPILDIINHIKEYLAIGLDVEHAVKTSPEVVDLLVCMTLSSAADENSVNSGLLVPFPTLECYRWVRQFAL